MDMLVPQSTPNLHSGSANDIFGTVCLENCHSDLQRGQDVVVSQNRSDQGLPYLLTQSIDQCSKATIQMTPWSLWDTLVIERTYYAYRDRRLSQQLHSPGPEETPVDAVGQKTASSPMWSDIVGRGSIDSNENIHSSHRAVFSFDTRQGSGLFHIPLVPRELLWTQSAATYCLSPRVAWYRGERSIDSNEQFIRAIAAMVPREVWYSSS